MISRKTTWLKASGICGILTPIIAFTCILLAISYSPSFSWTQNALSDLGIQSGTTAPLFNYGLISSGIIALIFASGLFSFLGDKLLGKIGAAVFTLAVISLTAIGVFPESVRPTHFYVSVAFFMLFPISMLLIVATFLLADKKQLGWFTFKQIEKELTSFLETRYFELLRKKLHVLLSSKRQFRFAYGFPVSSCSDSRSTYF